MLQFPLISDLEETIKIRRKIVSCDLKSWELDADIPLNVDGRDGKLFKSMCLLTH